MIGKLYVKLSEKIPKVLKIALTDNPRSRFNKMRLRAFSDFHYVILRYYDVSDTVVKSEDILNRVCGEVRIVEQLLTLPRRGRRNFCVYGFGGNIHEYTIFQSKRMGWCHPFVFYD